MLKKRLEGRENLEDIFLNYEHIPIKKALQGTPTHRREITWITQDRTYEDITTVMPVKVGSEVESALVMSMSIEDLKTTIAHATGYSSRYSLYSMVGETSEFLALQHKASRIARSDNNILLQGEPGTGKQRLAHGIHQASPRAAAPLIVVKCSNAPLSTLEEEFFRQRGRRPSADGRQAGTFHGRHAVFRTKWKNLPVEIGRQTGRRLKIGLLNKEQACAKICYAQ